jgi:hypothetical protein
LVSCLSHREHPTLTMPPVRNRKKFEAVACEWGGSALGAYCGLNCLLIHT